MAVIGYKQFLQKNLKHDCFSKQTPESDFWAGFIAADGNISDNNRISIGLSSIDQYFIQEFAKWCNSKHTINCREIYDKRYNTIFT